ncbi:MAG TPA: FG-GAP repeat protein [Sandaracinaceae bacterium]
MFVRTATGWAPETKLVASDGAVDDWFGRSVALSADGRVALIGAFLDDTSAGEDAGSARVFALRATNGSACESDDECVSGHCVDGVCCESECGGGLPDCQACSVAAGGREDGACTPLRPDVAPTVVCRPAVGACDAEETCTNDGVECPADRLVEAMAVCRQASCTEGEETLEAVCDGASAECPAPTRRACEPYVCGDDTCSTSCTNDRDCVEGHVCEDGACVRRVHRGSGCGCAVPGRATGAAPLALLVLALALVARRRPQSR